MKIDYYEEWCKQHGVTHGHCPNGCKDDAPIWCVECLGHYSIHGNKVYAFYPRRGIVDVDRYYCFPICGRCVVIICEQKELVPCSGGCTQDVK